MEDLIFWGIVLLGTYIGGLKMLYKSYYFFWSLLFSIVIGLGCRRLFESFIAFLPASMEPLKTTFITGFLTFMVYFFMNKLEETLNNKETVFLFNKVVNRLGGAIFGFFSGMLLANFLFVLIFMGSFKLDLKENMDYERGQTVYTASLLSILKTVDVLSFQNSMPEYEKMLKEAYEKSNPKKEEKPEEKEKKNSASKHRPMPRRQSGSSLKGKK